MMQITSVAEKSDQASRFFVLNRSLRHFTPAFRGGGSLFVFLSTGAEAEALAYYQGASPRRRRFHSPAYPTRVSSCPALKALTVRQPEEIFALIT
jgi:hypothetical protein